MANLKLTSRAEFARMAGVSAAAITKACSGFLKAACVGSRINMEHKVAEKYLQSKQNTGIMATGFDPHFEDAVIICREANRYSIRFIKTSFGVGTVRATKIVALMKAAGVIPEPGEPKPIIEKVKPLPQRTIKRPAAKPIIEKVKPLPQRTIKGHTAKTLTKKAEALQNLSAEPYAHEIPADMQIFADMTLRELIERFGTDTAFLDWLKAIKELENIEAKRIKNAESAGVLINRELVKTGIVEPINNAHIQLLTDGAKTLALKIHTMVQAGEDLKEIEISVIDQMSSFISPVKTKITKALKKA